MLFHIFFKFRIQGYGTALTFKSITDADIVGLEDFVKNELFEDLKLRFNIVDQLNDEQFLALFFAAFVKDIKRFKVYFGHRKLIRELVAHTKKVVDTPNVNDGLAHFARKMTAKQITSFRTAIHCMDKNCFFVDHVTATLSPNIGQCSSGNEIESKQSQNENNINIKAQKDSIYKKALKTVQRFEKKNNIKRLREFVCNFVNVNGSSYDNIKGSVSCCFCHENSQNERVKLFFSRSVVGGSWTMSNLSKHLKLHHMHNKNLTLLELKVEPCTPNGKQLNEISKLDADDTTFIEDCTDQLLTQMSLQCIKMVNATLLNAELVRQVVLKEKQMEKTLKVCSIAPDGDCLFAAIAHQLNGEKIGSVLHQNSTAALKKQIIEYIKNNIHDFERYLLGRVIEYKPEKQITDKYADFLDFLDCRLSNRLSWGGFETMKAVTELLKINIVVLNENGICKLGYRYNAEYNRSVILSYRDYNSTNQQTKLPNHYDSIIEISDGPLKRFSRQAAQAEFDYQSATNQTEDNAFVIEDSD